MSSSLTGALMKRRSVVRRHAVQPIVDARGSGRHVRPARHASHSVLDTFETTPITILQLTEEVMAATERDFLPACRKGYHELNSGTLGVFIDPSRSRQVLIPYSAIPGLGTVLQARVTEVPRHTNVPFWLSLRALESDGTLHALKPTFCTAVPSCSETSLAQVRPKAYAGSSRPLPAQLSNPLGNNGYMH
jgi:hypothetical protein